jgi:hypothetical protein
MNGCTAWREIEPRIDWFLGHNPSARGMCAQHSWHAIGGDIGCPPAWGAANANAVVDKLRAAGKLYTTDLDAPPRGAYVVWEYGENGHAAISLGNGQIATTDPSDTSKMVGIEPITYPAKWGAKNGGLPTGWTDYYSGVYGAVGTPDEGDEMPLSEQDLRAIADMVWSIKTTDPVNGESVSMRKLLERARTNAKQAAEQTKPPETEPLSDDEYVP